MIKSPLDQGGFFVNSKLIGYDIVGSYANVDGATARARVIHALDVDTKGSDLYKVAFVEFLEGSSFTAGATLESTYPSEIHTIEAATAGVPEGQEEKYQGHKQFLDVENAQVFNQKEFLKACEAMGITHRLNNA